MSHFRKFIGDSKIGEFFAININDIERITVFCAGGADWVLRIYHNKEISDVRYKTKEAAEAEMDEFVKLKSFIPNELQSSVTPSSVRCYNTIRWRDLDGFQIGATNALIDVAAFPIIYLEPSEKCLASEYEIVFKQIDAEYRAAYKDFESAKNEYEEIKNMRRATKPQSILKSTPKSEEISSVVI